MRLMFYINAIHHGGAERVMVNLAKQFAASGDEVSLVTSYKDNWEYELAQNVKRINLCEVLPCGFVKRNITLARLLREAIKSENPDILVSFMAEPNFRALVSCAGLRTKNLISIRNDPNKEYSNRIFRFLGKNLYKLADGVVFQTSDAKEWFPQKIQSKSRIIMNQVDEKFYAVERTGKPRNIITTGRLTKQKNHEMLIRAYAKVCDKVEDDLVIYGEGELRDKLEALISELGLTGRVHLPGATKDVPLVLAGAKLFVLSSDYEGMPNSLLEAMAVGVPCISTDCPCGGPREIIENGINGMLCPVGDVNAMAGCMLSVLVDEPWMNRLSSGALERAAQFAPDAVFYKWSSYIDEIVR